MDNLSGCFAHCYLMNQMPLGKEDSVLTNITMQTFASEGDIALVDQRWEKDGPVFLKRLFAAGLLSYEKGQI